MDPILLIGLLIIVFIGIPVGLGLLIYFVPRKLGYPRAAKYLALIYSLIVAVIVLTTVFQDQLFTKNDAKELVEEQKIILSNKFTLDHNESASGIGDYYHTFTLTISDYDKQNAIADIENAADFKPIGQPAVDFQFGMTDRYEGPKQIQNYETKDGYVREYFKPEGKGYAPTYRRITIKKFGNELVFEDIDD